MCSGLCLAQALHKTWGCVEESQFNGGTRHMFTLIIANSKSALDSVRPQAVWVSHLKYSFMMPKQNLRQWMHSSLYYPPCSCLPAGGSDKSYSNLKWAPLIQGYFIRRFEIVREIPFIWHTIPNSLCVNYLPFSFINWGYWFKLFSNENRRLIGGLIINISWPPPVVLEIGHTEKARNSEFKGGLITSWWRKLLEIFEINSQRNTPLPFSAPSWRVPRPGLTQSDGLSSPVSSLSTVPLSGVSSSLHLLYSVHLERSHVLGGKIVFGFVATISNMCAVHFSPNDRACV